MNEPPDQGHDTPVQVRIIWDAGIASPDTRSLEQAERDLFLSLVKPHPGASKVWDVQFRDFTLPAGGRFLWAEGGFAFDSPAQHQIAVGKIGGVINVLLGRPQLPDELVPGRPGTPDAPVRVRIISDAGIASPVDRALKQAERKLFLLLASLGPSARKVWGMQYRDFTLSAGGGFLLDSPALPPIAIGKSAGAVNVLLRWPLRPDPFPPFLPVELPRPYGPMGPFDR